MDREEWQLLISQFVLIFLVTLEARATLRMEIVNEQLQLTQIYFLQVFRTEDRTLVQECTTPAF